MIARTVAIAGVMLVTACGGQPPSRSDPAKAPDVSRTADGLRLVAGADEKSVAIAREVAEGVTTDTEITRDQSFRIMQNDHQVATLVTGSGVAQDSPYRTCFVAVVANGRPSLVSTIGTGSWEAETCGSTDAVAIVAQGTPAIIGLVYSASSPNAQANEPVVMTWDSRSGALRTDETLSRWASLAGAQTIEDLRRVMKEADGSSDASLPAEVRKFATRRDACDQLRGEDRSDEGLAEELERTCRGTDAQLADLRRRYSARPPIIGLLAQYEASVE